MNIVYLGSDVYLDTFRYLADTNNVLALYTYHNDEDYFMETGIVTEAKKRNIPVHYEVLSADDIRDYCNNRNCELIYCAEYDRIIDLPEDVENLKAINVHASLLPKGRSYYPIECAYDKNEAEAGVTMHKMVQKLDSGAIIFQKSFKTDTRDSIDMYLECGKAIKEFTVEFMKNIDAYWDNAKTQQEKLPYWKRPEQDNMLLNNELSIEEASELYRKYNKMLEVVINDKRYYVISLMTSNIMIDDDYWLMADDYGLYRCRNGHLRLTLLEAKHE